MAEKVEVLVILLWGQPPKQLRTVAVRTDYKILGIAGEVALSEISHAYRQGCQLAYAEPPFPNVHARYPD